MRRDGSSREKAIRRHDLRPAIVAGRYYLPMPVSLTVRTERWPVAGSFTIARGSRTEVDVVVAELSDGTHTGRGECVPYRRYGETIEKVIAAMEAQRGALADGLDRTALQTAMAAGAARNAIDCAFWDLEAKRSGRPVHALAGLPTPW